MTIHIRNAQSKDVHQLAELARVGYETSPVYSFVRTKAREFPEDTEKSYRQELRVLIANPRLLFTVLEVTVDDHNHCTSAIRAQRDKKKCHTGSKRWDFKLCGATNRKIVGFAIWRLNPKSQEIHESLLNDLKYVCVSLRVRLTSLFWKSRDTDPTREDKIARLCHEAQNLFEADSMELEQMVVHPDFQRQRYGTRLGEDGLRIARKEGRAIWVIATPMGEKLYESLGFIRVSGVEAVDGEARCSLVVQVWRGKGEE